MLPEQERIDAMSLRASISQGRAMLSAVGIVAYFAVTTVWLPSALLRSSLLTGASTNVSDVVAVGIWGIGFGFGIWGLRRAQDRGWI
jgi:hypothetical protein